MNVRQVINQRAPRKLPTYRRAEAWCVVTGVALALNCANSRADRVSADRGAHPPNSTASERDAGSEGGGGEPGATLIDADGGAPSADDKLPEHSSTGGDTTSSNTDSDVEDAKAAPPASSDVSDIEPTPGSSSAGSSQASESPPDIPTDPVGAPVDGPDSIPTAPWYLLVTESSTALHNVAGSGPELSLDARFPDGDAFRPWSADGTQLATLEGQEVVFYELADTAIELGRHALPEVQVVVGWLEGFGALAVGRRDQEALLLAIEPDGTVWVLGEGENGLLSGLSTAPDGQHVVWSSPVGSERYDLWTVAFTSGVPSEAQKVAEYQSAPPLDEKWSADGRWMAFGIYGQVGAESGVHLLGAGASAPIKVSTDDVGYAQYFEFSSDGSALAMWLPTEDLDSATLSVLGVGDSGAGEPHVLASSQAPNSIAWAPYGNQFIVAPDGVGTLQRVAADGSPTESIDFPAFSYEASCSVQWLNAEEFVYNGCTESDALTFAHVQNGAITTTEVLHGALPNLALSEDKRCLMDWDASRIRVGPASLADYSPTPVTDNGWEELSHAAFAPDGSVVWTRRGTELYRVTLDGCLPASTPELIRTLDAELTKAEFILSSE